VDLYNAFIVAPHTQGAQVWITQLYMQITPYLLRLPHKRSSDGVTTDCSGRQLLAAYIYRPKRM